MRNSKRKCALLAALLLLPLGFRLSAQTPSAPTARGEGAGAPAIFIGPGDMISVAVFETPELTASLRVSQTGDINLPVLGRVYVAGLTAQGAALRIQDALRDRGMLIDPHVTVSTTEFASQGATVLGEVHSPGVYPTLGSRRLLDMLALAGGVSSTSGRLVTIIHRGDPDHPEHVALQPTPAAMREQKNPVIQPGDTVDVAKAGVVYIMGDVLRPGGILVDNNERLSVIEALSLAGGLDKTAAMSKTKLIRRLPAGREEVDLDLKRILYGKQADVLISDGDILYVPTSTGKTLLYRGTEALFGIGTQLAYYLQ
jgi:polysaccharide export outer membrane protein